MLARSIITNSRPATALLRKAVATHSPLSTFAADEHPFPAPAGIASTTTATQYPDVAAPMIPPHVVGVDSFLNGTEALFNVEPSFSDPKQLPPPMTETEIFSDPAFYAQTLKDTAEAMTLPPEVYANKTFAELEGKRIWQSRWICVGHTQNAKNEGDVYPFTIHQHPLFIANFKGKRNAFHNVCRHRGAKLVTECMKKKKTITCPYHRWGYALNGKLIGTPLWEGTNPDKKTEEAYSMQHVKNFDKNDFGLLPARYEEWGGMMFVNLDGQAPPLMDYLGDITQDLVNYPLDDLVIARTKTYRINANWKLLIENYLEYYHLPAVHPALCGVSGVGEHVDMQGRGMYSAFATMPLTKGGTPVDPGVFSPFPGITEAEANSALHFSIFPNMFSSVYPHHTFRVFVVPDPEDPGKSIEYGHLLMHPDIVNDPKNADKIDAVLAFHDNVNAEDIGICEQVQDGTRALAYTGGRFSFKFEESVHRFQKMVADAMLGGFTIPDGYPRRSY